MGQKSGLLEQVGTMGYGERFRSKVAKADCSWFAPGIGVARHATPYLKQCGFEETAQAEAAACGGLL